MKVFWFLAFTHTLLLPVFVFLIKFVFHDLVPLSGAGVLCWMLWPFVLLLCFEKCLPQSDSSKPKKRSAPSLGGKVRDLAEQNEKQKAIED